MHGDRQETKTDGSPVSRSSRCCHRPHLEATSALAQRITQAVAVSSLFIAGALMAWTWSRAAAMSADGAHYMELARLAWNHGSQHGMDWYAGPGFPVAAAWVYGCIGDLDFAGRLTACGFAIATLVAVALLTRRMFNPTVACVSVALLAVHTTFVRHSVMAETDSAYGCWLVWSILIVWELRRAQSGLRQAALASLAGLSLGLGYLTRPEAVPLALLLGLWYLFSTDRRLDHAQRLAAARSGWLRRAACATVTATVFLIVASPYLLKLRADLGRWSLSGKERSIVLKFVPDKKNYEQALKLGVAGALLRKPQTILHWIPYHLHWGIPQLVKSLNPIVLVLGLVALWNQRRIRRERGSIALLLWVSVPFLIFFFLTFPGRRYFMQAMPAWTILAAVGTVHWAERISTWRATFSFTRLRCTTRQPAALREPGDRAAARPQHSSAPHRAFILTVATPIALMILSTIWGTRHPIEQSLIVERRIGERILDDGGPGKRVLGFTVSSFYAQAERVPIWGPMEGIVRTHGYGSPLSYEQLVDYVRKHRVDYVILDHDLRADCPEFLDRVRGEHFQLVSADIVDHHGTHFIFRTARSATAPQAN